MTSDEPKKKKSKSKAKGKQDAAKRAGDAALDAGLLASVDSNLEDVIARARAEGVPALGGGVTVSLHLELESASTPVDAVNQVLTQLALNGLRGYTFMVRDEMTDDLYAVTNGQVTDMAPARQEQEPYDPHGDEKHRVYEEN